MKRRWPIWIIVANLVAIAGLAFAYPHLMVSPGPLVKAHQELAADCFACHASWRGASAQRCMTCHALGDIGLRTTKGAPLAARATKASFHQQLVEQDCMACHMDHYGAKLAKPARKSFSHGLLRKETREKCETCHTGPPNEIHRTAIVSCAQCHKSESWKPATFDHDAVAKAVLVKCEACHKAPGNELHTRLQGNCGQCHAHTGWKPATFDHARLFELDRDHDTDCTTCHTGADYSRYTCYGCHEHTPGNIRSEHAEEGISDFENCVRCHRNARDEPEKGGNRGERGKGGKERD